MALLADPADPDHLETVEPILRRRAGRAAVAEAIGEIGTADAFALATRLADAGLPRPVAAGLAVTLATGSFT
jgi:hypothetical protein